MVAVLALAGCAGRNSVDQSAGASTRYVAGRGPAAVLAVTKRGTPTNVAGPTLTGGRLELASLRGHVVVINIWASWCAPCRAETPQLVNASADLASDGVRFVGIQIKDTPGNGRAFIRTFHVPYPSIADPTGTIIARFRKLPPAAIPSTLILDRAGRVAVLFPRPVQYGELVEAVRRVLDEPR